MELPYLASISIYPIKSLEPVLVPSARFLRSGALAGDRMLALVDREGKFVNGKRNPLVHRLRSSYDATTKILRLGRAEMGLQVAFNIERQKESLEQWLHEFFGIAVSIKTNTDVGFPDDLDCPGPTLLSTATLADVASWFPPLDVQSIRLRVRANLEIAGVPPFWEDRLYGPKGSVVRFQIGDCLIEGNNPCQRCAVPPRDPFTGAGYADFAKIFMQRREATLPDWAERSRFNHFYRLSVNTLVPPDQAGKQLNVGDEVKLLTMPQDDIAQPLAVNTPTAESNTPAHSPA